MTVIKPYNGYVFGSDAGLSYGQMRALASCLETPQCVQKGVLGGRGGILRLDLQGVGKVVVKSYFRGGLIRYASRQTHVRVKSWRSASEFGLLAWLKSIDVSVPEPVAWIVSGRIFYRAWLVTREMPEASTLADIAAMDNDRAACLMAEVRRQVEHLIEYKVFHVDFHPGNVLVDLDGRVFIIDFDRARTGVRGNTSRLRRRYERRWRRAVTKHNLPVSLVPLFGN
ncbi:MAG: phosphotransferase [Deltaproteobacteria bacterium]|nr:phosphotransferase [Deltaproteobacteria bacterium]